MTSIENISEKKKRLLQSIDSESQRFKDFYHWLETSMPPQFFEEVCNDHIILISHNLMTLPSQDFFSTINLKRISIVLCLDSADVNLRALKNYALHGIKDYLTFASKVPPPFPEVTQNLRIIITYFTEAIETIEIAFPETMKEELRTLVKERNHNVTDEDFNKLIGSVNNRFLRALPMDRLILVVDMYFRAQTRDNCQYEVRYNQDWLEDGQPSMSVVLAWRNTPKHNFLYRLARIVHRHGLMMTRVNASYVNPYGKNSILLMSLSLHGIKGEAAWETANIPDFLRELVTVKYFASFDTVDAHLVSSGIISGSGGNFIRASINFIHQMLVNIDSNLYTLENIEKDLYRHPELTAAIYHAFDYKFNPEYRDFEAYETLIKNVSQNVSKLDTGHEYNDTRCKNVLNQAINFIKYTLKTNFFRHNYTALIFRLDPEYLNKLPYDRKTLFPELPYAIFFIKGMHFFGFHIRFKDLSRGGLRTIYLSTPEHIESQRNNVFTECYNLAYTQQKKNKDIPEGGAKGVIFLTPFDRLKSESLILENELKTSKVDSKTIEERLAVFQKEQREDFLYQSQRAYVENLLSLINCEPDGRLKPKYIVDYWQKPEYIYLGPDENMHDSMIEWIAEASKHCGYKPGSSFISGKPELGINHKEYGVTSLGVNVYMHKFLEFIGIDPTKQPFTIKISGGPDGDVAGNQILNLHKYYKKTAKLVALTDISGTINDPEGLDLDEMAKLFHSGKAINNYPAEKLHEGGFLLDLTMKRDTSVFARQTLCRRKVNGVLVEDWLSGNDMNHLYRFNVHQTEADVFIPGGGRPKTLNIGNVTEYLNPQGIPTSKIIIEGANLYLTQEARRYLEEKGVLIVKDSSANKCGVICSSFEVLSGLSLGDTLFIKEKEGLVKEILERLNRCASLEADLMIRTYNETNGYLTDISDTISDRINKFTYEILNYLEKIELPKDENDLYIKCFLNYCPVLLSTKYRENLLHEIPDLHKKAIIAANIGAHLVYENGLQWYPSVVDVLPVIIRKNFLNI